MRVMKEYTFYDADIEKVIMQTSQTREIVLKKDSENALVITKKDVIALAKEFDMIVYDKDSAL